MATDNIEAAINTLRHDEGCSAGIDAKYRCRCNVEKLRAAARAELATLKTQAALACAMAAYIGSVKRKPSYYDRQWVRCFKAHLPPSQPSGLPAAALDETRLED